MDRNSKKHKHKKHKKDKKKKSKHSSSESENEWIEKKTDRKQNKSSSSENEEEWAEKKKDVKDVKEVSSKRDEWMSFDMDFTSFGHKKENKKETDTPKPSSEKEIQISRELNPYWRDGGTGLPPEKEKSMEKCRKSQDFRKYETVNTDKSEGRKKYDERNEDYDYKRTGYHHRSDKEESSKSRRSDETDRRKSNANKTFKKPHYDVEEKYDREKKVEKDFEDYKTNKYHGASSSSRRGWKKDSHPADSAESSKAHVQESTSKSNSEDHPEDNTVLSSYDMYLMQLNSQNSQEPLSRDEMNMLCAKIFKAERRGDKKLAEKLQMQLDIARKIDESSESDEEKKSEREVIVLTETDSKGFTRPLKSVREERLNTKRKIETHEGNKRVRYFADDDSQSLSQMFEREKFSSSRDQNATFVKLMGKEMSTSSNEDAFEETASMEKTSRQDRKDWDMAIREHNQKEKALDNCYWCLDSKNMKQDVIVAVRNQVQLCVPSSQSLTDGHCVIVPNDHVTCATNLDEDVWEDIMSIRKNLVKMFEAEGEDIIFFESASNLDRHPHMQLHCVPVPKETGEVAPIYFKKAIMECEMEWSNNKKVIDLSGKNVRKAVPKGLPYFAVDFGMQPGYAHVIEDKRLFPNNFAQAIIGGMLDIDHSIWRKLHRDTDENIRKKADYLKQLIQKHL